MDTTELHERVNAAIGRNLGNQDRTADQVMWIVRAALADKDAETQNVRDERDTAREEAHHANGMVKHLTSRVKELEKLQGEFARIVDHLDQSAYEHALTRARENAGEGL